MNNFLPLLFIWFHTGFGLDLQQLAGIVSLNFSVQIIVDFLSAGLIDRIGYKAAGVAAHVFAFAGMLSLAFLPELLSSAYAGILLATVINAVGGGLLEVLVSPVAQGCPRKNKEASMSLIHSFYCWGHVFLVLVSTAFFALFGVEKWQILAVFWSLLPLFNSIYFALSPMPEPVREEKGAFGKQLFGSGTFILLFFIMFCAGASEQAMSQWASAFAEAALGVSKTVGDLFGPCLFAVMMGVSRMLYTPISKKISLENYMPALAVLCILSYALAGFANSPAVNLFGCALCGFSCAIMWPGTFSLAAKQIPGGGTAMFAFLALAGDLGCAGGPWFVGRISEICADNLKTGISFSILFPIVLLILLFFCRRQSKHRRHSL